MPLLLEPVIQPTEQDLIDLGKIAEEMGEPADSAAQWVERINNDRARQLFATRFNDRLLAIAEIHSTDNQWLVERILVREITRRRGVGSYLLKAIAEEALHAGAKTVLKSPNGNDAMVGLCRSLHWQESSDDQEIFFSSH